MSRWSIPELGQMTPQGVFERAAYHMLAHGGSPVDLFIKPESLPYVQHIRWGTMVHRGRAPKHCAQLLIDLERAHRTVEPHALAAEVVAIGRKHRLTIPN